jgi:hypothetical protein
MMDDSLKAYFSKGMSVSPPPDAFMIADWYPAILRKIETFVGGFVQKFDTIEINDWYRPFQEQARLFGLKKTAAEVSEHCFAAAIDVAIPEEFHGKYLIDFFSKVVRLDPEMRIGWFGYQKPDKRFTFFHVGWGFMIPFDVTRKYVNTYFEEPQASEIYHKINQNWKPGVRW